MNVIAGIVILVGFAMVLGDERVGRYGPRGPEAGAAMARSLGLILLVGGGLAFLAATR
jgi:hypothetical protein